MRITLETTHYNPRKFGRPIIGRVTKWSKAESLPETRIGAYTGRSGAVK